MNPCELSAEKVSKRFGQTEVLHAVSLSLYPGWTAIVGPNGAGKSTLLKCLAGLLSPDSGRLSLDGRNIATLTARERGRRIAWMAQQSDQAVELEAREVVNLGRLPHVGLLGSTGPDDVEAVTEAMRLTGSVEWQDRPIGELSGGERQRTLLARVLAVQADVMLLDEPTSHLDPEHQVALVQLMKELGSTGTVVSVLHDLNLALLADRLVVMAGGRVVAEGRAADLALHASLTEVFAGAIRIRPLDGKWIALPVLGTGR